MKVSCLWRQYSRNKYTCLAEKGDYGILYQDLVSTGVNLRREIETLIVGQNCNWLVCRYKGRRNRRRSSSFEKNGNFDLSRNCPLDLAIKVRKSLLEFCGGLGAVFDEMNLFTSRVKTRRKLVRARTILLRWDCRDKAPGTWLVIIGGSCTCSLVRCTIR